MNLSELLLYKIRERVWRIVKELSLVHKHNIESIYKTLLSDLNNQLNAIITQLIDTYVLAIKTLGTMLMDTMDGCVINYVSEKVVEMYREFIRKFNRSTYLE